MTAENVAVLSAADASVEVDRTPATDSDQSTATGLTSEVVDRVETNSLGNLGAIASVAAVAGEPSKKTDGRADAAAEAAEDAWRMHTASTCKKSRMRMPAILITFAIEMIVAFVISRYTDTLRAFPLLISFQPVVSAISGNVGLQTSSILVRNLALGISSERGMWRSCWPELKVGIVIATIMAFVVGLIAGFWYSPWPKRIGDGHTFHGGSVFGLTMGICVWVTMACAAVSGALAPLLSKRCGFDPSAMGGPMETAFQDIVGSVFLMAVSSALLDAFGDSFDSECPGGSLPACIQGCQATEVNATVGLFVKGCMDHCLSLGESGACAFD